MKIQILRYILNKSIKEHPRSLTFFLHAEVGHIHRILRGGGGLILKNTNVQITNLCFFVYDMLFSI